LKSEGRLDQQDLPDLIQELNHERWTGTLRLEREGQRIGIVADAGRLVFATSSNPDYRLGPRLLRRGLISLRQMEEAGRAVSPGKRFGTVLVEQGIMDAKELARGVIDQTRDIILLSFRWGSGRFRLEAGPPAGEAIQLNISAPQLILDGVSQVEAWSRVERGCGGLAARYAVVPGSEALFNQLTLDVDQAALARAPKKGQSVEQLLADTVLNHFEACRTLWAFRVIGLVKRLEEAMPLDDDGLEYVLPADGA
jgi:Domain of unknown function (DUF4388)